MPDDRLQHASQVSGMDGRQDALKNTRQILSHPLIFSHDRERLIERSVLIQIFAKSRNEWPQTGLRHVWDQLIEHAALPEQRMGSVFGGVDLEMAVHAEAFAGGAEKRQKHDGEGVQKKKPVAPLRIGDAKNA